MCDSQQLAAHRLGLFDLSSSLLPLRLRYPVTAKKQVPMDLDEEDISPRLWQLYSDDVLSTGTLPNDSVLILPKRTITKPPRHPS